MTFVSLQLPLANFILLCAPVCFLRIMKTTIIVRLGISFLLFHTINLSKMEAQTIVSASRLTRSEDGLTGGHPLSDGTSFRYEKNKH